VTEAEAQAAVEARVGAAATATLSAFAAMVIKENSRQNLIAPATEASIWARHLLDSVQLLALTPANWSSWIDIGTGAGFPGMAIAASAPDRSMTLVEPRRRRAEFLEQAVARLSLSNVRVVAKKVEQLEATADVISARAVAPVEKLLPAAIHCATTTTTWVLPRGQLADDELTRLRAAWKGVFHVEPSVTDDRSAIIIASGVAPR
jgi:16S rRNA (guanine527-N7)-methyltransferase